MGKKSSAIDNLIKSFAGRDNTSAGITLDNDSLTNVVEC